MTLNRHVSKLPLSAQEIRQAIHNTVAPVINRSPDVLMALINSKKNAEGKLDAFKDKYIPTREQMNYGTKE